MRSSLLPTLWFLPVAVFAADAPPLTLARALARSLEKSPRLGSASLDIRAAEAKQIQAKLRPSPTASLTEEDFLGSGAFRGFGGSQTTLELNQLIELGGKRSARMQEAAAIHEGARLDYENDRVEVVAETAAAFVEALAAQRRVELAEEYTKLAAELEPAIRRRAEVGQASALEQARGAVAVSAAEVTLEQAKHEFDGARRKLAALWGDREPGFARVAGDLEKVPALAPFKTLADRIESHPSLARINATRAEREAVLAKEKAAAVPDITGAIGPRWLQESRDAAVVASISIPLNFRNRNQGNIAAAQAKLGKTDFEFAGARNKLLGRLGTAWESLMRARHTLEILDSKVVPQAKLAIEAANTGYANGKLSQIEVLDARRTYVEAGLQRLQALAEIHKEKTEIDALTGAAGK